MPLEATGVVDHAMQVVRDLHAEGHRVVIVSSGAVGVGAQRLGLATRPKEIAQKQALAAVGQVHLMRFYEDFFHALGLVRGPPDLQMSASCFGPCTGCSHSRFPTGALQADGGLSRHSASSAADGKAGHVAGRSC